MATAHAHERQSATLVIAPAAAGALRRSGRAVSRDLLLGLVLHDARTDREWPGGPGEVHGGRFCLPHQPLRPRSKRHAHLLSEPLAAAILLPHGRIARRRRPG